jgi:Spy/CpxP family protein refolding chaperone
MVKRIGTYTSIILLCLTAAVMAQEGPQGRWWHSPEVVSKLNLSGNEIQRLEKAFDHSRSKMIQYKNKVEAEQTKLQSLLEKRQLDENAVKAQNRKLEEARTALATERTAFVVEVRKIIGYERFQRLADMQPKK